MQYNNLKLSYLKLNYMYKVFYIDCLIFISECKCINVCVHMHVHACIHVNVHVCMRKCMNI